MSGCRSVWVAIAIPDTVQDKNLAGHNASNREVCLVEMEQIHTKNADHEQFKYALT